ncbi:MAG: glycosyl hydrolase family 28 protein [Terracidiphilus sp.]|nr:glycosyl hydrolase family 28 protein [Terracidiphilus sp.]
MIYIRRVLCIVLFALSCLVSVERTRAAVGPRVVVYPRSTALAVSTDFAVYVRVPDGNWQSVPVYTAPVSTGIDVESDIRAVATQGLGRSRSALTSISIFDFAGKTEIEIQSLRRSPKSVRIRPEHAGVVASLDGNTIRFSLQQPRNLSIEMDGDIFRNLQLFAGEIQEFNPQRSEANMIHFGPGVHAIGTIDLPSGANVFLDGGAVVIGGFSVVRAHDVQIRGHGILISPRLISPAMLQGMKLETLPGATASARHHDAILIDGSNQVKVSDLTIIPNGYTVLAGQSENVEIRGLKSISAGGNNDGIDVFSSRHVLIDGVYMRNSDDNIALYGHRWNYYGDLADVTVQNSTLWADVAHPILVGTHGDPEHPETLSQLRFRNIDILDQREPQLDYQGCMSLNAGDSNLIKDVLFEDIRVDDIRMGQLLNLRVMFNRKYNTSPGRGIEDVVFRNVSYNGTHAGTSLIAGYDDQRAVRRVRFEGLKMNGVTISDSMRGKPGFYKTGDIARIFIGEHVDDVVFGESQ